MSRINFEAVAISTGIPVVVLQGIESLDASLDMERAVDKCVSQAALVYFIGNQAGNKLLNQLILDGVLLDHLGWESIRLLRDLSYKTRYLYKLDALIDVMYTNFQMIKAGAVLGEQDKLSLKAYGILHDLAKLNNDLNIIKKIGLINGNQVLLQLYERKEKSVEMMCFFDESFGAQIRSMDGIIISYKAGKKAQVCESSRDILDKAFNYFIKFTHTAYGFLSSAQEKKMSHIDIEMYHKETFSLKHFLYSDVHELQLESLVSDNAKTELHRLYGEAWLDVLKDKYATIERNIHDNTMLHQHVVAEYTSWFRRLQLVTPWLQGGHQRIVGRDHDNESVRDQIYGRAQWEAEREKGSCKILCSEFVGMTLIAAVQELNDDIKTDLVEKGLQDRFGLNWVDNPISEKEKLHLLTPRRLIAALEARGVVTKIEKPEEICRYIATSTKASKATLQVLPKASSFLDNPDIEPGDMLVAPAC